VLSFAGMALAYRVYILENNKMFIETFWKEPVFYTSNYILILLVVSSLLSFRFLRDKIQTQALLEAAEKEKISTELSFLKAQINPHFLFNSLNNILFQIDKSNSIARETLLKFSEMLRYQLYECSSERIEIEKEVRYMKNYIEIQMLRKTEKYQCDLAISDAVKNFQIAPLLLIPFIENAFKHISNHDAGKNSIRIIMDYLEGEFIFSIINDKDTVVSKTIQEATGIGFANVQRRLDLLYPDKYNLEIENGENQFRVILKMNVADHEKN
jgi:LytS/YehU family sensor histidine kinase